MTRFHWVLRILVLLAWPVVTLAGARGEPERDQRLQLLASEVSAVERDFAKTMADRDLQAFAGSIAQDAVFRSGQPLLVGRGAVVEGWRDRFKPGPAPFSWEPDRVTVADSEAIAVSSGPVRDHDGKIAGRFTTVWHKETTPDASSRSRVIVDQGVPLVECGAPKP